MNGVNYMTIEFFNLGKNSRNIIKAPSINVSKAGRLTFNRALTELVVKDNEYVLIGQDKKNPRIIAFKFVPDDQNGQAFRISVIKQTNSYYTSALTFFRAKHIDPESIAKTYEVKIENDLVIIELDSLQESFLNELEQE